MPRNPDTTRTDDEVQREGQPGVTAADLTAGSSGAPGETGPSGDRLGTGATGDRPGTGASRDPLASGPGGDPLAAGLAGRPLTAVRDEDAAAAPEGDRGPADGPVGTGFRGVPPTEGEWVAGTHGPGQEAPAPGGTRADPGAGAGARLLTDQAGLRERWLQIQSGFIDDPRASVTEAAGFVGEIATTIVTAVQERERSLRGAWDTNGDADTEDLRNALREYRTFFELLTKL
jgi:hypothetical protein